MPPRHGRFAHQRVPIAATSRFFPGSLELLCRIKPRQAKCCLEMALLVSHFNFIFISDSTEALCYTRESQLERIQFLLRLWDLFQAECIAMRPDNSTEKRPSVAVGGCILSVWQWMTPVAACVKSTNVSHSFAHAGGDVKHIRQRLLDRVPSTQDRSAKDALRESPRPCTE